MSSSSPSSPGQVAPEDQLQSCHPQACAIQACIQKNTFNQAKCEHLIDALYKCCSSFYASNPKYENQPDACPTPKETEGNMKSRGIRR